LGYDAAIIGAGAEGLAAAALLGRFGAKTILIERSDRVGGRLVTREFHPGFRVSPFADELPAIPAPIHWALDLTRRGTTFLPVHRSLALWPDGKSEIDFRSDAPAARLLRQSADAAALGVARAMAPQPRSPVQFAFQLPRRSSASWPRAEPSSRPLADVIGNWVRDPRDAAHLAAIALMGRAGDPTAGGSAAHLLAPGYGGGGIVLGGHGRLADALLDAARAFGVEISLGLEASEIRRAGRKTLQVILADGSTHEARAVISTLDLKRTFLSLFPWNVLPSTLVRRVGLYRFAGATGRVLFALARRPDCAEPGQLHKPIHVRPDMQKLAAAHESWRMGSMAAETQEVLRVPSALDPSLAPRGAAVMTVTFGAGPCRPFDGAWTEERRRALCSRALYAAEQVWPGVRGTVLHAEAIVPADIEEALGASEGDLDGGEIAPDQLFDLRPWPECPRTPIRGLYLGGRSASASVLGTCAAGAAAAQCVLADLRRLS
jgi:phytoene dehydrogenase-like protein